MARIINDKAGYQLINISQNKTNNPLVHKNGWYVNDEIDDHVLHGFALPCPGCQLNYFNFLLNKKDYWNHLFCDEKVFTKKTEQINKEEEYKKIEDELRDEVIVQEGNEPNEEL